MSSSDTSYEPFPDPHHDVYSKTVFGFWLFLLTDFVLFGVMLATFVILRKSSFGGPTAKDLFHLPYALVQSFVMLLASFVIGIAGAHTHRRNKKLTLLFMGITFLVGFVFLAMSHFELNAILKAGFSWKTSAFLSAFFTISATHQVHILFGLFWILLLAYPVLREGLTEVSIKRITCLRMFWQFLNILWIFVFIIVYLLGVK